MFKIHTNDGVTSRVDLSDEDQAKLWLQRFKQPAFQETITGISVLRKCSGHFRCGQCNRKAHKIVCPTCGNVEDGAVCGTGVQYSLSKPIDFDRVFYYAEHISPDVEAKIRGGERITCFADGVKVSMMVHACQSAARISLTKTGKQRYNPYA